jgi:hypothetical protein
MGPEGSRMILPGEVLYESPLANLKIGAVIIENDSGDVEDISARVSQKIAEAGAAAIGALTGVPAEAVQDETWYMDGIGAAVGLVLDGVLGIGDDPYPASYIPISWQELAAWPAPQSYTRPGEPLRIEKYTPGLVVKTSGIDDAGDNGQYFFYFLAEHMNPPG